MMTDTASARIDRHQVAVHGSVLGANLRCMLRTLGYGPAPIADTVEFIGTHGTATGCPTVDEEDRENVNALVIKHTQFIEYESPVDWPAWTDEGQWITEDAVDAPVPPGAADEPIHPSPEDRSWWAVEGARFDALTLAQPPIRGGSPDERPVKVSPERSRAIRGDYSDWDKARAGAV
jgi:hypothetical protein